MKTLTPETRKIDTSIDKFTFFGVILILLAITLPLIFFPSRAAEWVGATKRLVTTNVGVFYYGVAVLCVIFVTYIGFSDIGKIKAGEVDEEPEYKTLSWAAMLFSAGIGSGILYWGTIEWAYYYQSPPFGLASGTKEAVEWAATYGIFHWGPLAWMIYLVPALIMTYYYHVRKQPKLKISQCLTPILGEKVVNGRWGKTLDIFFVIGMIGGGATSLGLASPMITEGLHRLFGLPQTVWMQLLVLLLTTFIFAFSAYRGMKKGIQLLANVNFYLAAVLLAFVFVCGPSLFMLEVGLESMGRSLTSAFRMMTWIEAFREYDHVGFKNSGFPQDWTIFYWAWWVVFAPTIGIFIAKISKGRTLRQIIVGTVFFGSLGCAFFFIILGNYGLFLQLTNALDVVGIVNTEGATVAIFSVLSTLPMGKVVMATFTVLVVIFSATTYDSVSYILAAVTQKEVDDEPVRWNRLFWALVLCFVPAVLLFFGDLSILQTASIFAGAPLIIILVGLMLSLLKIANQDMRKQKAYRDKCIYIVHEDETPSATRAPEAVASKE